jgi:hypothetical protein
VLTVAVLGETARSQHLPEHPAEPATTLQAGGVLIAPRRRRTSEPLGFRLTMLCCSSRPSARSRALSPSAIGYRAGRSLSVPVFFYWLKVPLPIGALGL